MILLALTLASSPSGSQNFLTEILIQVNFFKDHGGPILPYLEVVSFTKLVIKLGVISHFEMRTSNVNSKRLDLYRFEVSVLVPELADLGFVRETLIFKSWKISDMIGQKYAPLQGELSNVLLFLKRWREALGTGSPSFPNSSSKIPNIISKLSLKVLLLCV